MKGIQPPNRNWPIIFQKFDILAYFALVTLCGVGNLQYWCQNFSASPLLVRFHYTHLLLLDRGEPDNAELLHVYLTDCFCMTNIIE